MRISKFENDKDIKNFIDDKMRKKNGTKASFFRENELPVANHNRYVSMRVEYLHKINDLLILLDLELKIVKIKKEDESIVD